MLKVEAGQGMSSVRRALQQRLYLTSKDPKDWFSTASNDASRVHCGFGERPSRAVMPSDPSPEERKVYLDLGSVRSHAGRSWALTPMAWVGRASEDVTTSPPVHHGWWRKQYSQ